MSWAKLLEEHSSLATALDLVGDRWTLMIMAGSLASVCRFNDLEKSLGINRNILKARLDRLVDNGLLKKIEYSPNRFEYQITPIGQEMRPILVGLASWAERHITKDKTPITMTHAGCGGTVQVSIICDACDETVGNADVTSRLNDGAGCESIKVYHESREPFFIIKGK